jgi:hypothetical protein
LLWISISNWSCLCPPWGNLGFSQFRLKYLVQCEAVFALNEWLGGPLDLKCRVQGHWSPLLHGKPTAVAGRFKSGLFSQFHFKYLVKFVSVFALHKPIGRDDTSEMRV